MKAISRAMDGTEYSITTDGGVAVMETPNSRIKYVGPEDKVPAMRNAAILAGRAWRAVMANLPTGCRAENARGGELTECAMCGDLILREAGCPNCGVNFPM